MSDHFNARELSQAQEGAGSAFANFDRYTQSSADDFTNRDRAHESSAIGGASSKLFPQAEDLLNGLLQGLQEEKHNNETMPLGTVPYPDTKFSKQI